MKYSEEFQRYIDAKIPRALQEAHSRDINLMWGAWAAGAAKSEVGGRRSEVGNIRAGALCFPQAMTREGLIAFENEVKALWEAGDLPYLVHLCGGNEDQLLEIFREVGPEDWVFSTHRSHYHYLLAGGSPDRLMDLIKRGSSMFVFDKERNFLTSSVLAGTCCIAAGVAWQMKEERLRVEGTPSALVDGKDNQQSTINNQPSLPHVWCFLGDGAEDEGHFYEAVCFVQGHDLPCTFVIEDNDRSVDTSRAGRGRHQIEWPSCVRRYHYTPTYPHAGSGCKFNITFNSAVRPS